MSDGALVLTAELADRVDAWMVAEEARHCPPLSRADVRKGIQALSKLYVARRVGGRISQRAADGAAKRAAFAVFYAPLHFLTAWAAADRVLSPGALSGRTVLDLGCGTGAAGAAIALHGQARQVVGIDCTGWSLTAAQRTWTQLAVAGKGKRGSLPGALGWPKAGEVLVFGWSLNELSDEHRADTLRRVESALRKGCGLVILEPLSRRISPWWSDVSHRLGRLGASQADVKVTVELPPLLRDLDRAAGLDHRLIGARVMWRPPA